MSDFKNEHLDKLWTNIVPYLGGMCTTSEIVKLVRLFRECDMAIEDEADDCEHWRTMYGKTCKEVDMLKESISLRDRVIDKLGSAKTTAEKERDEYKSQLEDLYRFLGKWRNPKARDNFEDPQMLRAEIASLKESLDIQKKSNEALLSANMDLAREKRKLEDSLNYAMIQQLEARVDELSEENKKLKARADGYKEQSEKIRELKSRLNSMYNVKYGEYVRSRDTGYKNGRTDLWDMLQNVNDAKPFELAVCFPDVSSMDDILSWDLEDFLDAYKSWQEKKEQERIKHMRDYLVRFCMWRRCDGCPLHTDGFICGRGKGFCDMTYEELKKHYEKVGDCGRCPFKRKDD